MEIEIKCAAESAAALILAKDIFISLAENITRQRLFETTLHYYDTDDFSLLTAGVVLRALDASPPHFGTHVYIKSNEAASDDAVFSRIEHEIPVSSPGLCLDEISGHPGFALLKPAEGKTLHPFFKTVNRREDLRGTFEINGKRAVLDCCLDHVEFVDSATGHVLRTSHELEIELKQAYSDPALTRDEALALLAEVGGILRQNIPALAPSAGSKADAGFAFYLHPHAPAPEIKANHPFQPQ